MRLKELSWHEFVAIIGGALLALGLFLPWYSLENKNARLNAERGPGEFTAFEIHDLGRWLWIAAAVAPLILAYIVLRGHALSWARGEMTAVTSIAAFGLAVYNGIIDKPGEPAGLIGLEFGFWVSLVGILLMLVGSSLRASGTERPRKPPGVL
jgi:hypothetical protein